MRTRSGFVIGPLAVSYVRRGRGTKRVEPVNTWAAGLLYRGWRVILPMRSKLAPWGVTFEGPALYVAWRL